MNRQRGSAALVFLLVLAASLLANAWLYRAWRGEHDQRTVAETKLGEANNATKACNDSIAGLEASAFTRGQQAEKDRAAAAERAKKHQAKADRELSTPATVPGNECQSAKDRVKRWLGGRAP